MAIQSSDRQGSSPQGSASRGSAPKASSLRVALAQINTTIGDIAAITKKHLDYIERAKAARAQLVVFPELSICGYPPKDLLLKPAFIDDCWDAVERIAAKVSGIDVVVGYPARNTQAVGRPLYNAVAVLRSGRIVSSHFKTLLPTYDVFDEGRYFEPGPINETENLVDVAGVTVGLSICEDLWNDEKLISRRLYHKNPIADLNAAGAELLVNASASPFVVKKQDFRVELFGEQVGRFGKSLVYVSQVGGHDELVFDGNSMVFDADGNVLARAKDFEEDLLVVDVPCGDCAPVVTHGGTSTTDQDRTHRPPGKEAELESIYKALVLGVRDYVRKCGFKTVVLGLSGGIDSALTAAIAVAALGNDKVCGVAMPSRFSSDHSVNDARDLAENLGIEFHIVPIKDVHDQYEKLLEPIFAPKPRDVTEENLQARVRGAILMAFSNKYNHLLLTTGNKSELAVGYCTIYGDMCGGLAVISDVPKTVVWDLSRFINTQAGRILIPVNSIEKVPSAELRPGQVDQDSLPPYPILDQIVNRYIEEDQSAADIIASGIDAATVTRIIKLIDRSEYKRRQAAPGLKVTSRAFGFGRRMPIAQNYVQRSPEHGEPSPVME